MLLAHKGSLVLVPFVQTGTQTSLAITGVNPTRSSERDTFPVEICSQCVDRMHII